MSLRNGGSQADWLDFVEIYRPLIISAIRRAGVPSQDIEDVTQAVLLQLVKVLPAFSYQKERGFFRSWLRRVAMNHAIDLRRKQRFPIVWIPEFDEPVQPQVEDGMFEKEFRQELLQAALKTIRPEFRPKTWECFLLRTFGERSAAQAALELNLTENAVFINTSRVLARLREFCAFHGEFFEHDNTLSLAQ
ncbi:RNA polymerase sigma factor [Planctomicrobium sp. SH661]|uniref:RNA polymerase sigma factor n=1 Tax=Planctomicrobium sp. SH661 TaxID=3448124 RepID=UPI003F5C319A